MGGRVLATFAVAALVIAGCGDEDFENKARAPVAIELSGVIQKDKVLVSPARGLGAGPFQITLSNQTDQTHSVTLSRDLEPGTYEVRAGSGQAVTKEIRPAVLKIGAERKDSNSDLLLP
jgi:hypothetical protein